MGVKCCRLCASSALQLEPVDFWALQASDGGDFGELCEINFHPIEVDIRVKSASQKGKKNSTSKKEGKEELGFR
ncbi:hypothetical protein ACE6H2_001175 [Prunus campanulata]